ncbi:MAG: hypothetical protein RL189_2184 [Pseudomonadota bacterium]|jgi:hypothetical protein
MIRLTSGYGINLPCLFFSIKTSTFGINLAKAIRIQRWTMFSNVVGDLALSSEMSPRFTERNLQHWLCLLTALLAALSAVLASCTPAVSWLKQQTQTKSAQTQSEQALVSNAFAYARYVAINLDGATGHTDWTDDSIRLALKKSAANSGLSPSDTLKFLSMQPSSSAQGSTAQRIDEFTAQHMACSESVSGNPRSCCESLAWPMAVLPEWGQMPEEQRTRLTQSVQRGSEAGLSLNVYDSWDDAGALAAPFRTQGLKAWLSVCHAVVTDQPETLPLFKSSAWFKAGQLEGQWSKVLHAKSRAKRLPRRIFKRADGVVSLAETLRPNDCSVLESEIIIRRPDGSLNFWVYDAEGRRVATSHFPPAGPSNGLTPSTIEKPSPDSCMGCHYNLKTREFNVMFPSAEVLNLPSTRSLPVLCQQPDDELAVDN